MGTTTRSHRTNAILAVLVLALSALAIWSSRRVPDSVRVERQNKLLPDLRRDRIVRIEFERPERFALVKHDGRWAVVVGARRFEADDTEVERILTEAEFASPTRPTGRIDAAARERYGLNAPRARVTLREADGVSSTFTIGGLVAEENSAYAQVGTNGFVVSSTFADAFARRAVDLRDRTIVQLEPDRLTRLEVVSTNDRRVFEREHGCWKLTSPSEGRVQRARIETVLQDLRDMRATRFQADDADDAAFRRAGLSPPQTSVTITRTGGAPVTLDFGFPCDGWADEVAITHRGSGVVACVGKSIVENVTRPPAEFRDDHLVWARADEVERVRVHGPDAEFSVRRSDGVWHMEGASEPVDSDTVEAWLTALGALNAEVRLEAATASAHGLEPAARWIEVTRTGIDGAERFSIGSLDADRLYASRDGEPTVFGLEPGAAATLVIDAARFRPRRVVHDVPDQLAAFTTETPEFRDAASKISGTWRMQQPFEASADPGTMRTVGERVASLDAERWVSLRPEPRYGLDSPRFRFTARFEGSGPESEPGDAGALDASVGRVREYALAVGNAAPDGGAYASLHGRVGVFVLPQSFLDDVMTPHIDRTVLELDRDRVQRIEIERASTRGPRERIVLERAEGDLWRLPSGASVDRTRVAPLLDRLALVRAPRAFGYGATSPAFGLGSVTLTVIENAASDGGTARTHRIELGNYVLAGGEVAFYARREGLDATLSVHRDVMEIVREFTACPSGSPCTP